MNKPTIDLIKLALKEDIGRGDITTQMLIPVGKQTKAVIMTKEAGVICGLTVAAEVFRQVDRRIKFSAKVEDGAIVKQGTVVARLSGPARGILTAERVALNFLQHLSGIATLTLLYKLKLQTSNFKTNVILLDTRKTIPGLRLLEKYAVGIGGGVNHRMGLYDAILIKDNHLKIAGGVKRALEGIRRQRAKKMVEVEAKTIKEVKEAVKGGADRVLLDNMNTKLLKQAVRLCQKAGIKTEASGGITLSNVAEIAATGVDYISVGALTHSAKALDINLRII